MTQLPSPLRDSDSGPRAEFLDSRIQTLQGCTGGQLYIASRDGPIVNKAWGEGADGERLTAHTHMAWACASRVALNVLALGMDIDLNAPVLSYLDKHLGRQLDRSVGLLPVGALLSRHYLSSLDRGENPEIRVSEDLIGHLPHLRAGKPEPGRVTAQWWPWSGALLGLLIETKEKLPICLVIRNHVLRHCGIAASFFDHADSLCFGNDYSVQCRGALSPSTYWHPGLGLAGPAYSLGQLVEMISGIRPRLRKRVTHRALKPAPQPLQSEQREYWQPRTTLGGFVEADPLITQDAQADTYQLSGGLACDAYVIPSRQLVICWNMWPPGPLATHYRRSRRLLLACFEAVA
jgi:hypothetical protein